MSRLHSHLCDRCKRPFACGGTWLQNHDGFPSVVCEFFTVEGEKHPIFRACEDCAMTEWCQHCAAQPVATEVDGDRVCQVCADALAIIRTRARRKSA
jgi:hypothetical protein